MQPQLIPVNPQAQRYREYRNRKACEAVAEMLKKPYTLQEACANLDKLRAERLKGEKLVSDANSRQC